MNELIHPEYGLYEREKVFGRLQRNHNSPLRIFLPQPSHKGLDGGLAVLVEGQELRQEGNEPGGTGRRGRGFAFGQGAAQGQEIGQIVTQGGGYPGLIGRAGASLAVLPLANKTLTKPRPERKSLLGELISLKRLIKG